MNPTMEIDESIFQAGLILLPRHSVHSRCRFSLLRVKALPQQIDHQVVEQSGELHLLMFPCYFPHACQSLGHALPALRRARVRLTGVLLDQRPSLPTLADDLVSLFEWFIGSTPLCDSSQTCTRDVWPEPSPTDLLPG
jgi:hypothetical protein